MSDINDTEKAKLLSRLKKLMAMANDSKGASQQERETAMRMAHSLMAKYNLTMAEAEASGRKTDDEPRSGSPLETKDFPWMTTCGQSLAHLFFCEYFITRIGRGKVKQYFVGRESNVYTAQEMTKYIIASIDREGLRVARGIGAQSISNFWRSFCKGAAAQVSLRCERLRKEAEMETEASASKAPGTALVLASLYQSEMEQNRQLILRSGIELKQSSHAQRNTSRFASAAGRAYGDKIGLTRQIGGASRKTKQLKGE